MTVPAHVPDSLVVSFDHLADPEYLVDPLAAWDRLRTRGPIVFSPRLGGYWLFTDADVIRDTIAAPELFSNRQATIPPFEGAPMVPTQLDPPEHGKYRKLIIPSLSPKAVERESSRIRDAVGKLLDEIEIKGDFDFVADFARPLPATIFAQLCDVPKVDSARFIHWVHGLTHSSTSDGASAVASLRAYMRDLIEQRRDGEGSDLLTTVARSEVDGQPISTQMAENMAFVLTLGGLDTTSGFLSVVWHYLATHPEIRHNLVADDASIAGGLEELFRAFTIVNITRTVVSDIEWHGVQMKAGDVILLALTAANRAAGAEPVIDADAGSHVDTPHLAFGLRNHRCIGMHLARTEIQIAIREWHQRFPDYTVASDDLNYFGGGVFGFEKLPLRISE